MTIGNWIAVGAVLVSVLTLAITTLRNGKSDSAQLATMMIKLEHLSADVSEIKVNMRRTDEDNKEFRERLVKVEESTKQAHKRINEIPGAKSRDKTI